MALPVFRIQGEIGKQVDGSLKHIQVPIVSQVVKTVACLAALHIELDGSSTAIGAALLCMTWNAVFVCPDEHGVVIFRILIERSRPCEMGDDIPVEVPLLHEVGIYPAHIVVGEWQRKELLWFRVSFRRRPKSLSLFSAQQLCDCLLKGASVVRPHEVDGVTALLRIMVEPLAASDGHTVI